MVKGTNGHDFIGYYNDELYNKLSSFSTNPQGDVAGYLNEYFEDSAYWFVLPVLFNGYLGEASRTAFNNVFPNSVDASTSSYSIGGVTYYEGVDSGWPYYAGCGLTISGNLSYAQQPSPFLIKFEVGGSGVVSTGFNIYPSSIIQNGKMIMNPSYNPKFVSIDWNPNQSYLNITYLTFNSSCISIYLNSGGESELVCSTIGESDPYSNDPDGPTNTGGGTGTFGGTGDTINFPSDPQISSVDTGFITLYNPTLSELRAFATYLWSNNFDLDTFKKVFAQPMSAVLGMSILPIAIPNGGSHHVIIGNIDTGISMNKAGSQFVTVDCGSLSVEEYWGSYLDYEPYTKSEIYLPFIGTHAISTDDIMGKTVSVKYKIDILSGACCAMIKCGNVVLYNFVGQCACSIPITGNDWTNVINGTLSIAASIGSMVASGGTSAPSALSTIAAASVNLTKPNIEKSGSLGGMGGMLGVQTPYLIITRPRQAIPKHQNKYIGYPSYINETLGDCEGFTRVEEVHLENIPGTETEIKEIENLLKSGVII